MKRGAMFVFAVISLIFISSIIVAEEEAEPALISAADAVAEDGAESAIAELPDPGILPTSMFYGFKTAFQNVRLALLRNEAKERYRLQLIDIRLAEVNKLREMSEELNAAGKSTEKIEAKIEKVAERYEKQIALSEERIDKLKAIGRNVTMLQEHVANMTSKHILVLQRVAAKVSVNARTTVLSAVNKSTADYETATRAVLRKSGLTEKEAEAVLEDAKLIYKEEVKNKAIASVGALKIRAQEKIRTRAVEQAGNATQSGTQTQTQERTEANQQTQTQQQSTTGTQSQTQTQSGGDSGGSNSGTGSSGNN